MTSTIDKLIADAADALLNEHGIERSSTDPLADFIEEIGNQPREWSTRAGLTALVRYAVELDRAQRGLAEAVAEVLDDRGAHDAAQLVRDTDPDDDLWDYLGPLLDDLQTDYTRIAQTQLGE